jgi:hypothetical protein
MKVFRIGAAAAFLLIASFPLSAQDRPTRLVRGDIAFTAGWMEINKSELSTYNQWHSEALLGAQAGWYWTDHLKTEVQAAGTSEADAYSSTSTVVNGRPIFTSAVYTFSAQHVSITQLYQFRDNQWFHPYAGAGIDLVHEKRARRGDPYIYFDPIARNAAIPVDDTRRVLTARAVADVGFKGYMSRRAFAMADLRLSFRDRVEETRLRFGVGVDF